MTATEREFRSDRARVVVRIEDARQWDNAVLHRRTGMALGALPGVLMQHLPPTVVYVYAYRPSRAAYAAVRDGEYQVHHPFDAYELDGNGPW